jgi:alanine racemase
MGLGQGVSSPHWESGRENYLLVPYCYEKCYKTEQFFVVVRLYRAATKNALTLFVFMNSDLLTASHPLLKQLPTHRAWVEVDLDALAENVRQIRGLLSPHTDLMAVVKADAYGHGAVAVAETVLRSGASWLGVATVLEGVELRQSGIQAPILLLGAAQAPEEIEAIVLWNIQPTLCTLQQAERFVAVLERSSLDSKSSLLSVHLKIDTGMSRLGTPWQDALNFVQAIRQLPHLHIASVYSHLATADEPHSATLWQQFDRFETVLQELQGAGLSVPCRHLANSAATFVSPKFHYDLVRVGLSLYGLYPAPHLQGLCSLRPVLSVKARITQVKTISAGTGVSYGHRFIASQETRIAIVAIGYADGVSRLLSDRLDVFLRGQRVQQIGAITMDQLMLDVTALPTVEPGDVVTLLGATEQGNLGAETWADIMGTIAWEILCGFKHRLPRITIVAD